MIAALYVDPRGPYFNRTDVDPWPETRDARLYTGPYRVVCHSPCARWSRYWSGGPSAKVRRKLGDDDGCFKAALAAVQKWGGVLEHPEASHAFAHFGLTRPTRDGWKSCPSHPNAWVCCVEQGHYGHPARKATWLYYVGRSDAVPPELIWGPSTGVRLDEGFHSKEERKAARAAGKKPVKRLSEKENLLTPVPFAELLISLAKL